MCNSSVYMSIFMLKPQFNTCQAVLWARSVGKAPNYHWPTHFMRSGDLLLSGFVDFVQPCYDSKLISWLSGKFGHVFSLTHFIVVLFDHVAIAFLWSSYSVLLLFCLAVTALISTIRLWLVGLSGFNVLLCGC